MLTVTIETTNKEEYLRVLELAGSCEDVLDLEESRPFYIGGKCWYTATFKVNY